MKVLKIRKLENLSRKYFIEKEKISERKNIQCYKNKTVITGHKIKVFSFKHEIFRGFKSNRIDYTKRDSGEKRKDNLMRARNNLIETIDTNANYYSKFITLTFRENTLDRDDALKKFKIFNIYFKRVFGENLKYCGVMERQKKRGKKEGNKGSWHFHLVVFNSQKLEFRKLKKCWLYGSIDIKKIDSVDNLGLYMAKYLTKDTIQELNKKAILKSRGLKKPKTVYCELIPDNTIKTYEYEYSYHVETDKGGIRENHVKVREFKIISKK